MILLLRDKEKIVSLIEAAAAGDASADYESWLLYKQVINSPIIPPPNPLPSKSDHSPSSLKIGVKYFTFRLFPIC